MTAQFDFQSLIDIGFVLLVTVACLRSFSRDGSGSDARRETWRAELKELEGSLRNLIQEAGAASRNLDRSLLQRKRELEGLLSRVESQLEAGDTTIPRITKRQSQRGAAREDELPNESWAASQKSEPVAVAYTASGGAKTATTVEAAPLEQLAQKADDTLSLSQQVTREVLRQQADAIKKRSAGGLEHAIPQDPQGPAEGEFDVFETDTFKKTSIMDPVTYRIARRLLKAGKELHVVARKVELPVSEIRLLDRLLREEDKRRKPQSEPATVATANPILEPQPLAASIEQLPVAKKLPGEGTFSSGRPAPFAPVSTTPLATRLEQVDDVGAFERSPIPRAERSRDLDADIEREIALL
ncbi:MAG: hypothetical protein KDD69_07340 [Bdellovibrionales bacterium]|nr:hypothetical protein [Bdellovibrionales bacterium]